MIWLAGLGGWAGSLLALWVYMSAATLGAVDNARKEEQNTCKITIENIIKEIDKKTELRIKDALLAGDAIVIDDDIERLCQGSSSCRDRTR